MVYRNLEISSLISTPRILLYILPAVTVSLLVNIPRLMEWEVRETWTIKGLNLSLNITHEAPTSLRLDPLYITYYLHAARSIPVNINTVSFLSFSYRFTFGILIPFIVLASLNLKILTTLRSVKISGISDNKTHTSTVLIAIGLYQS